MITQKRLREILSYDKDSGIFINKISIGNRKKGCIAGTKKSDGGVHIMIDRKLYSCHRLAWLYTYGEFPTDMIDHINGDRTDNRIINLREANAIKNRQNQRTACFDSLTGVLGVTLHKKSGKYQAQIRSNGHQIYLGLFDSKYDAHKAYVSAKRKLHEGCTI